MAITGLVKRLRLQTQFLCTSGDSVPINIGIEIFDETGTLRNDVSAGNGALLDVPPGATVTFGTTGTVALLETTVITIAGVSQGVARVVSNSGDVICSAVMLDSDVTPPTSMSDLVVYGESTPSAPSLVGHVRYYVGDRICKIRTPPPMTYVFCRVGIRRDRPRGKHVNGSAPGTLSA